MTARYDDDRAGAGSRCAAIADEWEPCGAAAMRAGRAAALGALLSGEVCAFEREDVVLSHHQDLTSNPPLRRHLCQVVMMLRMREHAIASPLNHNDGTAL